MISGTHSIITRRLQLFGENQRLTLAPDSGLNILLYGTNSFELGGNSESVIRLGFNSTLTLSGSYMHSTKGKQYTDGWLTLKGAGYPFRLDYTYQEGYVPITTTGNSGNLTLTDCVLANECTGSKYDECYSRFVSMTFTNATAINLDHIQCGNVKIDGGSVDLVGFDTATDSADRTVKKVRFHVEGISDYTKIDSLTVQSTIEGYDYADDCIWTDKSGYISLWFPEGTQLTQATIGGKIYYATVSADGENVLSQQRIPEFTTPAADSTLLLHNESFTLTADAFGAPTPTFQWQVNQGNDWSNITSATAKIYTTNFTAAMNGWQYRCAATNQVGTVYSKVSSVYDIPVITAQPTNQTVRTGETATFPFTAGSNSLLTITYQWQVNKGTNWDNITDATASSYTTETVTAAMDGWQYRCVVTYTAPDGITSTTVTSDPATLTAVDAPVFSDHPDAKVITVGQTTSFSAAATGNHTISYQWQVNKGTDWEDITDATANTYTTPIATESMDGWLYRCMATNTANGVSYALPSDSAELTVVGIPVIVTQPAYELAMLDEKVTFSVVATGNHQLSYQWQVQKTNSLGNLTGDFVNISGATESSYTTDAITIEMSNWLYRCIVTNSYDNVSMEVASNTALLDVLPPAAPVNSSASAEVDDQGGHGSTTIDPGSAGETSIITTRPDAGYKVGTVTVVDEDGNPVSVRDLGNGQYSFRQPDGKVTVTVTYVPDLRFDDVQSDAYYYAAVMWAAENGITGGVDETHFGPNQVCTRAQLAAFLYRYAQLQGKQLSDNWLLRLPFSDVQSWSFEAVAWCYENNIVQGLGNGLFGSNGAVTREQVVTMLYRFAVAMGYDVSVGEDTNILSYGDATEISDYAMSAFQWAVGAGVIQGSNGNLLPVASCTRAQIVTMLYRLLAN